MQTQEMRKALTLSSLSSENVSTMIPNTMFSPMVVTMIKNDTSNKMRSPEVLNSAGTSGNTWQLVG